MFKKSIAVLMVLAVFLSLFTGCAGETTAMEKDPERSAAAMQNTSVGFSEFDGKLIAALMESDYAEKSFTVSPLSFRMALVLAAAGADGKTRDELFSVLGVSSMEELNAWVKEVDGGQEEFEAFFSGVGVQDRGEAAFRIVNAVFENSTFPGEFLPDYLSLIEKNYDAAAYSEAADQLARRINEWVNQETNGLIPEIIDDASNCEAVLANALYLKVGWQNTFVPSDHTNFSDLHGNVVSKEFICSQETYGYYEDDDCRLVIVPLQGGIRIAFLLGSTDGFGEKLRKAQQTPVLVTIPKFDLDTGFDHGELCAFLRNAGCGSMFNEDADFSKMFSEHLHVSDIVQKARVHLDEEGLEAAAATIITMTKGIHRTPDEPVQFIADHAFSFVIYNGTEEAPQLLFYGQLVD